MWSALARLVQALAALVALLAAAVAFAVFLLWLDGPPRLPELAPPGQIAALLQLEGVPPAAVRYAAATAGWVVLAYVAISLALEALATLLGLVVAGAAAARRLRRTADRVTPGVVRRTVAAVAAALLTVWVAVRPPTSVAAHPSRPAITLVADRPRPAPPPAPAGPEPAVGAVPASVASASPAGGNVIRLPDRRPSPPAPEPILQAVIVDEAGALRPLAPPATAAPADEGERYTVARGDNLWWIALKLWGDGALWSELWRANEDRVMSGGRRFVDPRIIQPGDVLIVPTRDGARPVDLIEHVVREGETLSRIARRYLGDGAKAGDIFRANRGIEAPNGRRLTDPNLIWPGMTLRIPRPAPPPQVEPLAPPAPSAPVEPVATMTPPPTEATASPTIAEPDRPASGRADRHADRLRRQAEAEAEAEVSAIARRAAALHASLAAMTTTSSAGPALDRAEPSTPAAEPVAIVVTPAATTAVSAAVSATPSAEESEGSESYSPVLAGVTAGLLTLGSGWWVVDRLRRRRALVSRPATARVLPLHFSRVDPEATGSVVRPLAAQAAQRVAGLETDERVVVTERLLNALAAAGYPEASVITLTAAGCRAVCLVRLGAPPPDDLAGLAEAVEENIASPVDAELHARDELRLILSDIHVDERWAARPPAPRAPLLEMGLTADGVLAVGPEGLDGALLVAGADAPTVLQHALLGLAGLCRPDDLRVALLAGEPLAGWLRGLPHLLAPPQVADGAGSGQLLLGLHEELRLRQAGDQRAGTDLLLLVIDGAPPDERLAELRDLARDGARVGIGVIVALAPDAEIDAGLLDSCRGRLLTGGLDEAASTRLAGQPSAAGLAPGAAWWLRPGEAPEELRLFRLEPEEREACLAAMRAALTPAETTASDVEPAEAAAPASTATREPRVPAPAGQAVGPESAGIAAVARSIVAQPDGRRSPQSPTLAVPFGLAVGTPPPDRIAVRVFGVPQVSFGEQIIAISRPTVLEHLCYLALHDAHQADAESLLEALRGERGLPASGVRAIHTSTGRIRETLRAVLPPGSPDLVVHHGGGFALNPEVVWVDRWAFDRLVASAGPLPDAEALPLLRAALALYRGPICQGHKFGWVGPIRERYQESARDEVALVAAAAEAREGRFRAAIEIYQTLRKAEVLDDVLIQREMLCWARLGDIGALTAAFESWRRQLELKVEMRPMKITAELFARLVQFPDAAAASPWDEERPALVG